jgi:hypothetical protein
MKNDMLRSAEKGPKRQGKKELVKFLKGEKITRSQSVKAKCYDCNGMGESNVCEIDTCPLLPYSPFRIKGK